MQYALYSVIALGGALGALGRYGLSTWIANRGNDPFPWGTFVVNILGCFLLGLIYVLGTEKLLINPQVRSMITVGFLGAFTTFSTFSLETVNLLRNGEVIMAMLYVFGSITVGLIGVWLGILVAN
ncbi:MAG: fluoride efflux transporter CrcB [Peptococcia bacterium]|jgi:CrcB protein